MHRPTRCSPEPWPARVLQHVLKSYLAVIKHDDKRNDFMLEGLCLEQLGKDRREGKMGEQPTPGTASCAIGKTAEITFSRERKGEQQMGITR